MPTSSQNDGFPSAGSAGAQDIFIRWVCPPAAVISVALLTLSLGCRGSIGGGEDGDLAHNETTPTGIDSDSKTPENAAGTANSIEAFEVPHDQPQLLPFWVRLNRVAAVVGLPVDDALFDELRTHRLDLGDDDYANGIKPDRMWTPARMTLWVKSLEPVCASSAMRERYPALPGALSDLVEAAYGRPSTVEDIAAFSAEPEAGGLDESARYRAICLAILSSTEFVIQ